MRPLWKGALSFGLVNIPVRLYAATESKGLKFRFLHEPCLTPIKYQKHCPTCGREVPPEEIVRGYEYQRGRFVIIREEDLERIPVKTTRSIDILDFVSLTEIDPVYYDRTYYLEPAEGGEKAYALLLQAMEGAGRVAIARIVIRNKESLAAVRVREGCLVLETMFWADEIRSPAELNLPRQPELHEKEIQMARSLIENLSAPFVPDKYGDEYRRALLEVIEAKIEGEEVVGVEPEPVGKVVDLMAALEESIKLAQKAKGAEGKKRRRKTS
ncbi:MAG TPA: Ku protein [Firmicutes bacterium]|nr:Ku protein [Bacillota bacterium]